MIHGRVYKLFARGAHNRKTRDNELLEESLIVARRGRGNIETGYARGHCVYRTEFNEENAIPVR